MRQPSKLKEEVWRKTKQLNQSCTPSKRHLVKLLACHQAIDRRR
jgi:hypothetical protein